MGDLGSRLAGELKRQGLTAVDLSRISGEPVANIRRIASGETTDPRLSTLARIARGLGRSIDFLVWDVGANDPEMVKVISFFTYQWPRLTLEEKRYINGILRMMLVNKEIMDAATPPR